VNTNRNYTFAAALTHGLVASGVQHVCISPGSRNTPLALTMGRHPELRDWVIHDERSAGFFAVGLARATGQPCVLVSTSGTAAAEYLPAIVEARNGCVPLIVITADRPPELRNVGAPQAIDQVKMYGDTATWFHDAGVPDDAGIAAATALGVRLYAAATTSPAGPVHLNVPMRDPLAPVADGTGDPAPRSRFGPAFVTGAREPTPAGVATIAEIVSGRRTLVVAGHDPSFAYADAVARLAAALEAPILADVLSGLRSGSHERRLVAASPDLLAGAGMLDRYRPEVVIRLGALPTEKAVWTWLEANPDVAQILITSTGWKDPLNSAAAVVAADAARTAAALAAAAVQPGPVEWAESWLGADRTVSEAAGAAASDVQRLREAVIAARVVYGARDGSIVFAASSMPVRDLGFLPLRGDRAVRFLANRGANGIDGSVASALGAAAVAETTLLVGDVATLHDVGSLRTAALLGLPLRVVVVHNDGGGIFHFLPQADPRIVVNDDFERYLATPHGTDFVAVATAMGLPAEEIASHDALDAWLAEPAKGPRLAQLKTDRRENREFRDRVRIAAREALELQ
jgi:2-succinyl-5-enolpyruvyl-6-hydroxy-3-cyclohexene-1-carboxylate synthase